MFNLENVRSLFDNKDDFDLDCLFMSKEYKLKKVLLDNNLKKELIDSLIDKFIYMTEGKTIEAYDPIVKLDDKIPSLSVGDVGNLENVKENFNNIETVNTVSSIEDIKSSKAYIIILKKEDNKV
ncbi:hypothetical protein Z962_12875, partial [Clostridium botulinum C/D str. BKT12695]